MATVRDSRTRSITGTMTTVKSVHTITDEAKARGIELTRIDLNGVGGRNKVTFKIRSTDEPETLAAFARALR